MKSILQLSLLAFLTTCLYPSAAQAPSVGTFNRKAVVVAYYRSQMYAATLNEKAAALKEAKQINDTARVRELEKWGQDQQDLAHRQLAGSAPIDNILRALQPAFVEIRRSSGLREIVTAPYRDGKAQTIDVTDQILDWLKSDAKTRAIIKQLPEE